MLFMMALNYDMFLNSSRHLNSAKSQSAFVYLLPLTTASGRKV